MAGKKVRNIQDLPVLVKESLYKAKERREKKSGALAVGKILEMIAGKTTVYYVLMQNHRVSFLFEIGTAGNVALMKRRILNSNEQALKMLSREKIAITSKD